jgi:hypothetical protein
MNILSNGQKFKTWMKFGNEWKKIEHCIWMKIVNEVGICFKTLLDS